MLKKVFVLILCLSIVHSDWADYHSSSDELDLEPTQNYVSDTYDALKITWNKIQEGGVFQGLIDKTMEAAPELAKVVDFFGDKLKNFQENEFKDAQKFVQDNYHHIPEYISEVSENIDFSKFTEAAGQYAPSWDDVSQFVKRQADKLEDVKLDDVQETVSSSFSGAKDLLTSVLKNLPLKDAGKVVNKLGHYWRDIEKFLGGLNSQAKEFNFEAAQKVVEKNIGFLRKTWVQFQEQTGIDEETMIMISGLVIEFAPISAKAKIFLGSCLALIAYRDVISHAYKASHQDMKLTFNPSGFTNQLANRFVSKMLFADSD